MKVIKFLIIQRLRYRLWLYRRLSKKLNISTEHTASVNTQNLQINQWTDTQIVSDELLSNLLAESLTGQPLVVLNEGFDPDHFDPSKLITNDVNWNKTKTSKQLIDELYDTVSIKLFSNKEFLRKCIAYDIKKDMSGNPTHIVFKLITAKTK